METIYIGVDFHARQQTICYLKTETGELVITELKHQDKEQVRAFYQQFQGPVIVGLEASGYSAWFEALLEQLGCEVWVGHATEIRRRARWPPAPASWAAPGGPDRTAARRARKDPAGRP